MATSKSAKKRIRQNERRRLRNKGRRTTLRTQIKKFDAAVAAQDADLASERFDSLSRCLDKMAVRGIIHKNQAARRKSRSSQKLSALKGSAQG